MDKEFISIEITKCIKKNPRTWPFNIPESRMPNVAAQWISLHELASKQFFVCFTNNLKYAYKHICTRTHAPSTHKQVFGKTLYENSIRCAYYIWYFPINTFLCGQKFRKLTEHLSDINVFRHLKIYNTTQEFCHGKRFCELQESSQVLCSKKYLIGSKIQ